MPRMSQEYKEVSMQVSEIMHKGISSVSINDSVKKVAELMREEDIGAVPILKNGKPVGFVTDRDIVINCVASGYDLTQPISHAMRGEVFCVNEDDDVEDVTKLMEDKQVSRILVVDKTQTPVGMVSLHDLAEAEDDDESGEVLSEIKKH